MIRHIVFFSVRPDIDVATVREGLMRLGTIPHSDVFEVMVNTKTDVLSDEVDLVVYAEFADAAALEAYKAHPTWAETTAKVRPMRELRISADAESTLAR